MRIWIAPRLCLPPHRVTHPNKYNELVSEFDANGWGKGYPDLIGYNWEDEIQLVSGSHRWAAALATKTLIPVNVYTYEFMWEIWGTEKWVKLLQTGKI